jgi:pimeloyl-ACP methyl ester carboxylesterase
MAEPLPGAFGELAHLELAAELAGLELREISLPEDRFVELNGLRLHYLDWDTEGRPRVLLLHGGALNAHTWDLVCLALRPDYHCLALDQRGHGDSDWSPTQAYDLDDYVGDLEAFVAGERILLVGQSLGGAAALSYTIRHSDRVAGLVLVDVTPDVTMDEGAGRIVEFVRTPAELDSVEEFVERAREFNPARDPQLLRRSLLYNLRRLPNGKLTWKYDRTDVSPERFQRLVADVAALGEELPAVTCPTLVVRGAQSDVMSDDDAERLAERLPRGRWVRVEDAGHTVQGDNARGFVEALRPFLREALGS